MINKIRLLINCGVNFKAFKSTFSLISYSSPFTNLLISSADGLNNLINSVVLIFILCFSSFCDKPFKREISIELVIRSISSIAASTCDNTSGSAPESSKLLFNRLYAASNEFTLFKSFFVFLAISLKFFLNVFSSSVNDNFSNNNPFLTLVNNSLEVCSSKGEFSLNDSKSF